MTVQCNDCLKKCNVPFHIMGGKCKSCRSYNTTRVGEGLIDYDPDAEEEKEEEGRDEGDQNDRDAAVDEDWETDNEENDDENMEEGAA